MTAKDIRNAVAHLPRRGPDTMTGDTLDMVSDYKLDGDILEMSDMVTSDTNKPTIPATPTKWHTYVRVK
jgi:hypothetical protein